MEIDPSGKNFGNLLLFPRKIIEETSSKLILSTNNKAVKMSEIYQSKICDISDSNITIDINESIVKENVKSVNQKKQHTIEPLYAGYTRFEIELEFVQALSNPWYLNQLASQKYFNSQPFLAYLRYLWLYWRQPCYARYLTYPASTLRILALLQLDQFRRDILSPTTVQRIIDLAMTAVTNQPFSHFFQY